MGKNNLPLVSVIIPTAYREPSIILRAIYSVLEQTYSSIEVILVDDNKDIDISCKIKNTVKNISRKWYR